MSDGLWEQRPDVIVERQRGLMKDVGVLRDWRRDVDKHNERTDVTIVNLHEDMEDLKTLVNRLILAVVGLCLTIAGSSVGVVLGLG